MCIYIHICIHSLLCICLFGCVTKGGGVTADVRRAGPPEGRASRPCAHRGLDHVEVPGISRSPELGVLSDW